MFLLLARPNWQMCCQWNIEDIKLTAPWSRKTRKGQTDGQTTVAYIHMLGDVDSNWHWGNDCHRLNN